ncbi:CE1759 family FMN reductase [Corynebacterium vitaeruminis]|uniref:CE1759 family FMN reductase n=1 Tax=Corynebacterium vitaeruminis TaxID=38305 RepID=UPI0023FA1FB3|nr:CE1759 family FMN reductase [Corynebacterium vitaeruminis]
MSTLTIVHAGVSSPSSSFHLGQRIAERAAAIAKNQGTTLEIRELAIKAIGHDLVDCLLDGGKKSPALADAIDSLISSDAIIAVTPVYQSSYSGLFKMFFDCIPPRALEGIPVLIAANGGSPRHALVLEYAVRPLFAYLRTAIVPTGILLTPSDSRPENQQQVSARITRAANELVSLMAIDRRCADQQA